MAFWFELFQREVIAEGCVTPLTAAENQNYWTHYPREAQIRFYSYAPTSTQPIDNKGILENRKMQVEQEFHGKDLPLALIIVVLG